MVEKFDLLKHFGVYGVAIDNEKLLVIEKNSGPYQNRYDLPGGAQEVGESMIDTLEREILEETGFTVLSSAKSRLYSAWIYENDRRVVSHHIFNLFDVKLNHVSKKLPQFVADGKNDSDRAVWKLVTELSAENSSPLVLKVIAEVNNYPHVDKAEIYRDWKVNYGSKNYPKPLV